MNEMNQNKPILEINTADAVNYALQQNGIPLLQSLYIINDGPAITDAQLTVTSSPDFIAPVSRHIDYIPAETRFQIRDLDLTVNGSFLASLTESVRGELEFVLSAEAAETDMPEEGAAAEDKASESETVSPTETVSPAAGSTILAREVRPITALAYDQLAQWGHYPEITAAFVTPNAPEISPIIARAATLLEQWTGDPSLDAYQRRDPNHVLRQAAAVYGAIEEKNIVYTLPPAGFQADGQRIRLADTVINQKMGTCIDLALLYASCLEAIGLNALVIIQQTHAFTGVWLEEKTFPDTVQDDSALITKRMAEGVNEIAIVEMTGAVAGRLYEFDQARKSAESKLDRPDAVEYIIDIKRARLSGIRPLPRRIASGDGYIIEERSDIEGTHTSRPGEVMGPIDTESVSPADAQYAGTAGTETGTSDGGPALSPAALARRMRWERKLLDLGLRNSLINMRLTASVVPVLADSLDELEDSLQAGEEYAIAARPADMRIPESVSLDNMHDLTRLSGREELIRSEYKNHRLRSAYPEAQLKNSIKNLYRTARTGLEENGANTLYLALGLLRWYETERSERPRYAPVILLPVEMVRKTGGAGYTVRLRDEEAQMNITVLEKLKQDFGISVDGLDPLPLDGSGVDVRRVFTVLRRAVMTRKNWDVLESAYLGIFSFTQFVMWNDLRMRPGDLMKNKVVRSLMEGKLCWDAHEMKLPDEVDPEGTFLPVATDASQLYAIKAAAAGESFVLHGPPGTGKSQTITALIANALANGKTVLFVAEKMAALEVVQKRLDSIGIGPFCLELHSNKSRKRDVLDQLKAASEITAEVSSGEYARKAEQEAQLRRGLDGYARALHAKKRCGMSLYELINRYEELKEEKDLRIVWPEEFITSLDSQALENDRLLTERLVAAARLTGHPCGHVLSAVKGGRYTQRSRLDLEPAIERCKAAWEKISEYYKAFSDPSHAPEAVTALIRAAAAGAELEKKWKPEIWDLDADALLSEYNTLSGRWFLPRMLGINKLIQKLAPYRTAAVPEKKAKDDLGADLAGLAECRRIYAYAVQEYDKAWAEADSAKAALDGIVLIETGCGTQPRRDVRMMMQAYAGPGKNHEGQMRTDGSAELEWIRAYCEACDRVSANRDGLREWMAYRAAVSEAEAAGLAPLAAAYEAGLDHDDVTGAFEKSVIGQLCMDAIDEEEALNAFSGQVFNEKTEQFRRLDVELTEVTKREIYARLASRVPDFTREAAQNSELGILQRAIRSGGRGMSIRRLFEQIPNILPRLCPCMLMSPISAAQYLAADREPFDIVVFDEASQLPTCKAIGALARGRDAVVVGDPNQMPPTSFFMAAGLDEDALEDEDLESILDDCLALSMPQTHLLWHYRSRHESLIAFSNEQFYENKLYTFPSVNDRDEKVTLIHVDGTFDSGHTRQNREEAEAVITELKRRALDAAESGLSVGIVTFNINQQNLIEDMLGEACAEDPELERWAYEAEEPIFIKNLENVQGDERDVILFSVGYGPDKDGRISMNFGPLNRDGGWRRLNVAITRARQEMKVYSTLTPEQIDLSRTSARGVAALKAFLQYAEDHRTVSDAETVSRAASEPSAVAVSIMKALREKGYECEGPVGDSEYKIDVGVIDPDDPDRYILGILLDGPSYGEARTARDREVSQTGILEGLGWNVLRVWSMDWWDDCNKEIRRINDEIERLIEERRKPGDGGEGGGAGATETLKGMPKADEAGPEEDADSAEVSTAAEAESLKAEEAAVRSSAGTRPISKYIGPDHYSVPSAPAYRACVLDQRTVDPEDFGSLLMRSDTERRIKKVLDTEAPICTELLTRRVIQSMGISRAGSRIQSAMTSILRTMDLTKTAEDDRIFWWKDGCDPAAYYGLRADGEETDHRSITEVSHWELINALCYVLKEQISMPPETLAREAGRLLGYTRLGTNVTSCFSNAIRLAEEYGFITGQNGGNPVLTQEGEIRAGRVAEQIIYTEVKRWDTD